MQQKQQHEFIKQKLFKNKYKSLEVTEWQVYKV